MLFDPPAATDVIELFARAQAAKPSVAAIGSSDGHVKPGIGYCRTYVFVEERSERGVLDAIRRGHTVASDGHGALTGDPERVRLARSRIAAAPPVPTNAAPRLYATIALLALAALMVTK